MTNHIGIDDSHDRYLQRSNPSIGEAVDDDEDADRTAERVYLVGADKSNHSERSWAEGERWDKRHISYANRNGCRGTFTVLYLVHYALVIAFLVIQSRSSTNASKIWSKDMFIRYGILSFCLFKVSSWAFLAIRYANNAFIYISYAICFAILLVYDVKLYIDRHRVHASALFLIMGYVSYLLYNQKASWIFLMQCMDLTQEHIQKVPYLGIFSGIATLLSTWIALPSIIAVEYCWSNIHVQSVYSWNTIYIALFIMSVMWTSLRTFALKSFNESHITINAVLGNFVYYCTGAIIIWSIEENNKISAPITNAFSQLSRDWFDSICAASLMETVCRVPAACASALLCNHQLLSRNRNPSRKFVRYSGPHGLASLLISSSSSSSSNVSFHNAAISLDKELDDAPYDLFEDFWLISLTSSLVSGALASATIGILIVFMVHVTQSFVLNMFILAFCALISIGKQLESRHVVVYVQVARAITLQQRGMIDGNGIKVLEFNGINKMWNNRFPNRKVLDSSTNNYVCDPNINHHNRRTSLVSNLQS